MREGPDSSVADYHQNHSTVPQGAEDLCLINKIYYSIKYLERLTPSKAM